MCVGVEFLAFSVLFYTKSDLKKSVKTRVFDKKYTFTSCVGRGWIVIGYFLFEKQTLMNY